MELIIGGAYQGKLDYARETCGLTEADICLCTPETAPAENCRCWYHYEQYVLFCLRRGETPKIPGRSDAVVIADDIFCGVVPMDAETRLWREETGRALAALTARADRVTRLFCGLPLTLKG